MMSTILFLAMLAGLVWFWADSTRARESAVGRCARACDEARVQFLDQTVALGSLGLGRNQDGRAVFRRRYGFEFSTNGADRHRGEVVLLGHRVEFVRLEHPDGPFMLTASNVHTIH